MKWYQRTMAGVLTAAMGLSMLGGLPMAGAADEPPDLSASTRSAATATGEIQTVIRMDYPISVSKLAASNATLTLYRGEQAIASGALTQNGTLSFSDGSGASGTVTLTTASTRVLSAKVHITGLSAADGSNQYRIKLTGTGFKPYESEALTLDNYSLGLVLGTGDATFTQGDVNGDGKVDQTDVTAVKNALGTTDASADLTGDGKVDITDLTAITMAVAATGEAEIYTPWGCIDLVSASTGEYAKRYGMIYVRRYDDDTGDFARLKKQSFYWYQKVIATNGEDLD